jgi:hypothetical protein
MSQSNQEALCSIAQDLSTMACENSEQLLSFSEDTESDEQSVCQLLDLLLFCEITSFALLTNDVVEFRNEPQVISHVSEILAKFDKLILSEHAQLVN